MESDVNILEEIFDHLGCSATRFLRKRDKINEKKSWASKKQF